MRRISRCWRESVELTAFALAPFVDGARCRWRRMPRRRSGRRARRRRSRSCWSEGGPGAAALELVVREAASMRDGPTLWRVIVAVQRRRRAPVTWRRRPGRAARARGPWARAWFFGLPLDQPDESADARYLRFVAAHPGCSGARGAARAGVAPPLAGQPQAAAAGGAGYVRRACRARGPPTAGGRPVRT